MVIRLALAADSEETCRRDRSKPRLWRQGQHDRQSSPQFQLLRVLKNLSPVQMNVDSHHLLRGSWRGAWHWRMVMWEMLLSSGWQFYVCRGRGYLAHKTASASGRQRGEYQDIIQIPQRERAGKTSEVLRPRRFGQGSGLQSITSKKQSANAEQRQESRYTVGPESGPTSLLRAAT